MILIAHATIRNFNHRLPTSSTTIKIVDHSDASYALFSKAKYHHLSPNQSPLMSPKHTIGRLLPVCCIPIIVDILKRLPR
jgi:hypothetical protein